MTASLPQITRLAAAQHLAVLGGFHADGTDPTLPAGTQTLLLLGPAEPGFWAHITAQPEWDQFKNDGQPDPIDRWSRRAIGTIACDLNAKALFPFGGAPFHPFYTWALRTGRVWCSPIKLLVHADQGLMVSFRGALALKSRIDLPPTVPQPCDTCAQPCITACPVGALTRAGYDVPTCKSHLDTGADCNNLGCANRRACPISLAYARLSEHSAYHMGQFHR